MMGRGMMGGGSWVWMAFHMLFWVILIVGVFFFLFWLVKRGKGDSGDKREESAHEILKKRYARGEISREEFEEMKRELL